MSWNVDLVEHFVSECCMNFEGFKNATLRTTLQKTLYGFTVLLPNMALKPNLKYSSNTCFSSCEEQK